MPLPTIRFGGSVLGWSVQCVHKTIHASTGPGQFVNAKFHNRLGQFHQIYNFGAPGDKDELIDFEVKYEGHNQTNVVKIGTRIYIDGWSGIST